MILNIVDEIISLGFEYCPECRLIWCDKLGNNEGACPRCRYGDECSGAYNEIDKLNCELDEIRENYESAQEMLDNIRRMI